MRPSMSNAPELLGKAADEAKSEGRRLLEAARKTADDLSARRQEALRTDARNLNQAISRRTQEEVFAIARKALLDLATTSLEERIGEVFTRRLRELEAEGKSRSCGCAEDGDGAGGGAEAHFELPEEPRATIQNALNETFSADVHLRFWRPGRIWIGGIELSASGQKVAWSIADYLGSMERGVGELLKEQKEKPSPKASPNRRQRADEAGAGELAECFRPDIHRDRRGTDGFLTATSTTRGGDGDQCFHGHREDLRSAWRRL